MGAKDKKLRVLMIGPLMHPPYTGGIASFINVLYDCEKFRNQLYRFDVFNTDIPGRTLFGHKSIRWILSIRYFIELIIRLLLKNYNLVHIHCSEGTSFLEKVTMAIICRLMGVKAILHIHSGRFEKFASGRPARIVVRLGLGATSAVFVVSKALESNVRKNSGRNVYLIPNCVSSSFFGVVVRAMAPSALIFIGNLTREKGLYDLVEAMKILRGRGFKGSLNVIGGDKSPGDHEKFIEYMAGRNIESVELHGELTPGAVADLCRRSSIFILPSYAEGLPISILEAMSAGLPVIATRVGGIPDIVEDGVNGFLIDLHSPEQIADKVDTLRHDPAMRFRMGEANRKKVRELHSDEVVADYLIEVYREVLSGRNRDSND